jgi:hypothetical protein
MTIVPGTSPYAWPFDGDLVPGRLALVVAGADASWAVRSDASDACARIIRRIAREIMDLGGLVVRVCHRASPDPVAQWVDLPAHIDVCAGGIDGFYASPLDAALRSAGRPLLALAGFGLEGPVHSTLRSANDRGYECLTLRDACAALDPSCEDAAYSTIEMSGGIFGAVGTSVALLQTLRTTVPQEVR